MQKEQISAEKRVLGSEDQILLWTAMDMEGEIRSVVDWITNEGGHTTKVPEDKYFKALEELEGDWWDWKFADDAYKHNPTDKNWDKYLEAINAYIIDSRHWATILQMGEEYDRFRGDNQESYALESYWADEEYEDEQEEYGGDNDCEDA